MLRSECYVVQVLGIMDFFLGRNLHRTRTLFALDKDVRVNDRTSAKSSNLWSSPMCGQHSVTGTWMALM